MFNSLYLESIWLLYRFVAKTNSSVKSIKFSITTAERVGEFLDRLVETQMYGKSRAEVAENLIRRSMEDFLMENRLEKLDRDI